MFILMESEVPQLCLTVYDLQNCFTFCPLVFCMESNMYSDFKGVDVACHVLSVGVQHGDP